MDSFEVVSNIIGECGIDGITLHLEDGYPVLRLRGVRPLLRFVYVDGCIFHRHLIGRRVEDSRRDGLPFLLCSRNMCFYYVDDKNFYLLRRDAPDSICRILRSSIRGVMPYVTTRSELLSTALVSLMEEYLRAMDDNLRPHLKKFSREIARFMGYPTAFLSGRHRELFYRFLLFRWVSLHLIYRNSPLQDSAPLLLNPDWQSRRDFVENLYSRYFSSIRGFSDMGNLLVSSREPTLPLLSLWSDASSFTADLNWLLGFMGSQMAHDDLIGFLEFMGGDSTVERVMSMFLSPEPTFLYTGRFSTLSASAYMGLMRRGMEHGEIIRSMMVFTHSGAGVVYHSTALTLMGQGAAGKPQVFESGKPVYMREDFRALFPSRGDLMFGNMVYDVRDRDEISPFREAVLYGWSSAKERGRMFLLMRDSQTSLKEFRALEDAILENTRLNLAGKVEGKGDFFLYMNGNSAHPRSYTKFMRLRGEHLLVDPDFVDRIENAENRMDDRMETLRVSFGKPAKVFYYRDSVVDLSMILQRNMTDGGRLFLLFVPVDVWRMLRAVSWNPLSSLAGIHYSTGRCPRLPSGDVPMITRSGIRYVKPVGDTLDYVDFALLEVKDSFRVVDVKGQAVVCGGGVGIRVRRDGELLRWFLNSRLAYFLYRIAGSLENLPVPDIHPPRNGTPEEVLARLCGIRALKLPRMEKPHISAVSDRELFSVVDEMVPDAEPSADFYRQLESLFHENVFDRELAQKLLRSYWKYRFGSFPDKMVKGGGLF